MNLKSLTTNHVFFDETLNFCRLMSGRTRNFVLNAFVSVVLRRFNVTNCPIKKGHYIIPERDVAKVEQLYFPSFLKVEKIQTFVLAVKGFTKISKLANDYVNLGEANETFHVNFE